MLFFSTCANTPEVRFVKNNVDDEEERTTVLDSGLPQEAHVNSGEKFVNISSKFILFYPVKLQEKFDADHF